MPEVRGRLALESGAIFEGILFGAPFREAQTGEVVFNTCMTGYQEVITDPSYAGQVVVMTYPLIGNYGCRDDTAESGRVQCRALVVRELSADIGHRTRRAHASRRSCSATAFPVCAASTRARSRATSAITERCAVSSPHPPTMSADGAGCAQRAPRRSSATRTWSGMASIDEPWQRIRGAPRRHAAPRRRALRRRERMEGRARRRSSTTA